MKSETSITFVDRFANSTRGTHREKTWSVTAGLAALAAGGRDVLVERLRFVNATWHLIEAEIIRLHLLIDVTRTRMPPVDGKQDRC